MTDIPTDIEPRYRAAKYLDTAMRGGGAR
jgi:hypothetical protein